MMMKWRISSYAIMLAALSPAGSYAQYSGPQTPIPIPTELLQNQTTQEPAVETIAPLDKISVQSASKITHESAGLTSAESLGFSNDLWQGSKKHSLTALLSSLPQGLTNHRFRDLLELLLTLRATEPQSTSYENTSSDWLFTRVNTLHTIGADKKANQLLAEGAKAMSNPLKIDAALLAAQHYFLQNKRSEACAQFEHMSLKPSTSEAHVAWPIICDFVNGQHDRMEFKLSILREADTLPAWLPKWIDAMQITSPKAAEKAAPLFKDDEKITPFKQALLRPLFPSYWPKSYHSLSTIETLPLVLQTAIATDGRLSSLLNETDHLRLKEQLFLKGTINREVLYNAYANLKVAKFREDTPLSSTTAFRGVEGRARLYQKLVKTTDLNEQSDILFAYFRTAKYERLLPLAHRLFSSLLEDMAQALTAQTPPLSIAKYGFLNAAYHQNTQALSQWESHLREHQPSYSGLAFYRTLRTLASYREATTPLPQPNFSALTTSSLPAEAQGAMDLLTLVENEKATLASAQAGYQLQPDMNALGALLPLRNAVRNDAKGEVVLRIIALLEQPRPNLSPTVAAAAIRALNEIGYHSWADLLLTQQLVQQLQ